MQHGKVRKEVHFAKKPITCWKKKRFVPIYSAKERVEHKKKGQPVDERCTETVFLIAGQNFFERFLTELTAQLISISLLPSNPTKLPGVSLIIPLRVLVTSRTAVMFAIFFELRISVIEILVSCVNESFYWQAVYHDGSYHRFPHEFVLCS